MNEIEIPWGQIGAFGSFAIVLVGIVLLFLLKSKKGTKTSGITNTRSRCINDPRAQVCLTDLAMSRESTAEIKQDMKGLTEKTVEQTGILKGVLSETKKQTQMLEKVCDRMGRQ